MDTIADYSEWKMKRQQQTAGAANIVLQATEEKPDEIAGDLNLANEFGKVTGNPVPPLPIVKEYRSVFQQKIEEQRNRTILSGAPRLADWLRNPENAALSRDDLERLAWFERFGIQPQAAVGVSFGAGLANTMERAGERLSQMGNQFMLEQTAGRARDRRMTFQELLEDERKTDLVDMDGNPLTSWDGSEYIGAFARWVDARYADLIGTDDEASAREYAAQLAETQARLKAIPKSDIATAFEGAAMVDGASFGEAAANFGTAFVTNPLGGLAWAIETAGESAPQLGVAMATTLLTRNPAAGAAMGGAGSYLTERYVAPGEFFEEKKIDLSKPEDVERLLGDPELMQEAAQRGVIRGLVIGAFDMVSMGVAGRLMAGNPFVEALAQGATQAILGSAGEYSARVAAGQEIDWNEIFAEGLAELATTPVDMGIAGRRFQIQRREAEEAGGRKALFEALSGSAQTSELRRRMPDRFRDFVEQATANGPIENLYIPAETFARYFQDMGVDPWALVDDLDGVTRDDLDAALAGNSDLRIPTATYAAKMAGSEHDAFLVENMRLDPNQMTASEAAEFNAKAQDILQDALEEAERLRQEDEARRTFDQEIFDTMVSRLRAAGRSTDVATTEAQLYVAQVRTAAEDEGLTIEDYLKEYPLPEVRGALPEGAQFRNVDALTRTLAEARNRRSVGLTPRGMSLLEFIDDYGGILDRGGELRARDAAEVKRGRGKKTLRIARDDPSAGTGSLFGGAAVDEKGRAHGPDDVALAAIEAGYLRDHPVAQEYIAAMERGDQVPDITAALWDAIDEELRGNAQYSADAQVDQSAVENEAALDEFDEYLSQIGVSLDDPDDVIRAAIERDQSERAEGKVYAQDGLINTDSKAFKRWFGDSKIVNPDGSPKVMYHGSDADIDAFDHSKAQDKQGRSNALGWGRGKFYLTEAEQVARNYSLLRGADEPIVTDVYVSAQKPMDSSEYESRYRDISGGREIYQPYDAEYDQFDRDIFIDNLDAQIRSEGYDAIIDDLGQVAVFDPTQIKSIHNRGTWDASDPRIYYQDRPSVTRDDVEAFSSSLESELGLRSLSLFLSGDNDLKLNMIAVDRDQQGQGTGSEAMRRIIRFADENGLRVTLTTGLPDDGFGTTSKSRLVKFYKRFGFVENKGRNKDFSISDNMYREPQPVKLFQQMGKGARGSITAIPNGRTIIDLFEGANLSTVLHETGHYWLLNLQAREANGSAVAAERMTAIKTWWRDNASAVAKDAMRAVSGVEVSAVDVISAIEKGTTGDLAKDAAIDVGMQEQFARATEAYLMEGKAPNAELRTAFEKFRAWLISVYRRLTGLNVNLSDDMRRVFDRILATEDEVAKAQESAGGNAPVFATAEAMGLSQEEYDRFLKLREQAEDEAKTRLLAETMAPIKREQEKWYKDERAKVREEVEREVNAWRQYRAIEWMGNRRWLGENQPSNMPDMRLSKDILVRRYGAGVLKTLPRGMQTVYTVQGGADPDDVAGWFGFDSGDEMVRAMEAAPRRVEAIEAETDKLMRERHGDPLNDGAIEIEALDAIHSEKRGQWIAAELKAIAEVAGLDVALTAKEAREGARQTIARMRVRDAVASNRFLAAERKAAEEAERLGRMLSREKIWMDGARRRIASKARAALRGDGTADAPARQISQSNRSTENYNETVQRFIQAKRRQLVNHALYMESRKVADEVEKAENYVAKLGRKSTREKIAGAGRRDDAQVDYLGAIDELLDRYDFRRMSGAAEERRGALNEFIERMKAAGRENELALPERVLSDVQRKPYKTLPVEELRGVIDSLKNLEHIALRWNDLIDAQNQRKLDEVVADIAEAFEKNLRKRPPGRVGAKAEQRRNAGRQFLDMVLNAGTILREIDGFEDLGATYRNIKTPIDEAMDRLIVRKEKAATDLEALYAVYTADERRAMAVREHVPALGYALSKWEKIAIALNTGNEGNYQRLTDERVRGSLTEAQVSAVLASLDQRDADFVQSVWDYLETFRDDIAARERRTTGVEPNWVEARPIEVGGKMLTGGYYPLRYDPRLSSLARDDQTQEIAQSLQAGRFGKAQTRNGHLKERAQSSGRDVELDMSVLHKHVNQVVYDLELSEPVANSWRILQDSRVRDAFVETGKQADFDALETWLKDVAEGELRSADIVGRGARALKSNFTAAKLAFNLSTVAIQITGLSQSMVVVGKKNMTKAIMQTIASPVESANDIAAKSVFMRTRQTTFNKDIYDFYNDPKVGPSASRWGDIRRDYIGPLAFWLMTKVQFYAVDVPTWRAGYNQGMAKFGNDEAKAIAHADAVVKRAQASGLFSDRSAVERGSVSRTARQNDVVRLFTALGSYMFAKFNVAYERSMIAGRVLREEGVSARSAQEALSWTLDMAFLFTLEAVLYNAIKGRLPDDDDDDEGWPEFLAKETAFGVMSTIPFVRDIASTMQGFEGGGAYGAITKEASAPFIQMGQGEIDKALVKSIINGTGLATGIPSSQINRAVDAGWRAAEGEDVSPLEFLIGKIGKGK